jgi:cellulose synthase/poly-beta-1,6-N-acetylglucosamine synthase-like glycosyltransferase
MILWIALSGGLLLALCQGLLARGLRGLPQHWPAAAQPVSVLLAARNEAARLDRCLGSLLSQDYPQFEVLLVLDRCTDGSQALAAAWAARDGRLRVLEVEETPPGWSPKKWALQQALDAARHDLLLLTDADCRASAGWIAALAAPLAAGRELVLGTGRYEAAPGLLGWVVRLETAYTAFQYLGAAGLGLPYMAVGRSLGYTRAFIRRAGGMAPIASRLSGDDDLLVNRFADPSRTAALAAPEAATWSLPPANWAAWRRQKQRHVSASWGYRPASLLLLALLHGSHLAWTAALLAGLCLQPLPFLALLAARLAWGAAAFGDFWQQWEGKGRLAASLFLDMFYFLYNLTIVPAGLINRPLWRN